MPALKLDSVSPQTSIPFIEANRIHFSEAWASEEVPWF